MAQIYQPFVVVIYSSSLSHVSLFCDPPPPGCIPPGFSVLVIFKTRIVENSFSRGSSRPRNSTHVSCIGRQILYHCSHQGSLYISLQSLYNFEYNVQHLNILLGLHPLLQTLLSFSSMNLYDTIILLSHSKNYLLLTPKSLGNAEY